MLVKQDVERIENDKKVIESSPKILDYLDDESALFFEKIILHDAIDAITRESMTNCTIRLAFKTKFTKDILVVMNYFL